MTDPDAGAEAQLRRALLAVAPPDTTGVDPGAARRAGEARARTRTAVTTSLAFSLVLLAGGGSIYVASHRFRPATLGSDVSAASPSPSSPPVDATASPAGPSIVAGFQPTTVVAGRQATLVITYTGRSNNGYDITWGDGHRDGVNLDLGCGLLMGAPATQRSTTRVTFTHTYEAAGSLGVSVTANGLCDPSVATSFVMQVLPATPTAPRSSSTSPYRPSSPVTPSATPSTFRPSGTQTSGTPASAPPGSGTPASGSPSSAATPLFPLSAGH